MAIEKNSFKSSRLESEFSSHSREVMSSDEEEFRYNSGAVESEDDDDDEFDDCDSGAGSDDFDLLELGESGEEFCQVGDQTCSIPYELYDLQGLGDVLSMDVWNDVLTEEERFCLTQYLPDMDQETFMRTLKDLLTGCNLHFGNPLNKLFNMLKGGLCEPRVALYRQGLIFFQKHQHYHLLRKYQNVMVNSFCQIRDGWQNCRGYSIEEKLRVLNIMKTQNSYISEKMEEMESDESDREGSGDAFWGKRVKDRKHGQKSARYSGYGMSSAIDLLYPGKQTAAEPAKFGKQNSKGALKLTGTKGSTMKEFSSNFPSVHHEMEINAGYYGSQPLSHHGKIAGYDSGMTGHMRDRLLGDEDDDEGMYEVSAQRNFSRAGLKDKAGHFKMGKKHDGLRSEEYLESLNGFPMPLKPELYATGRKKTIHQLLDTTVSKPLNARSPFDFGSKANYVENLQQFPSEDRMIYGKGRISNPSLKGSRMELADESEPFWHGKGQLDPYLTNPSQKYSDWNSKSKKWKHQESSELKQNDFHSGYKAKPFQEKFRATLHSAQRGVAGSKGRRGILKNEETESDSSEEIDEEDDDNPLLRSKLAFPFPCDASDMKPGSNAKKAKFVKKNKRGGFDEHLSSIKAGNLGSRAEQKGKMLDYSRVNILSARELEENYLSGQGQLIDDNDEDDDNDDQPIYKLARNGRTQGDYRPSLREKQKGRFGVPQSNCMQDFGLHGEDLSRTQLLANDNEGIPRSGKKSQILEMLASDHQERSDLQLIGCSSTSKKRKIKEDVSFMDEQGDNEFTQLQLEDASSSKKRGKRKLESETGNSEKGVSELPSSDIREEDVHQESILQKKPFTLITPTVHTGFSFSIIHLLSAIRMAMTSLLSEDSLEVGKNLDQDDGRQKSEEERGLKQEGLNGVKTQAELDVNGSLSSHEMRIPSLAVQEIVNRVKSNPGDPCILETQEPLQDLVRGVLKIFSSKTAPLGAKGWKPLVVYEKSTKSWSWVGPVHHTSSDHEAMEEVTSPEAWGLNHKMLVKLVDSFANWLKNGQETLQQIGSLPAPPSSLTQYNFDEKERFRDLRAQKSLITITPSSEEVRAYFRKEEVLRYSIPDRAFSYTAIDGKKSIVAPLRRCGGKPTSKARDHFMLKRDRPPHVTILCLVRDAAARLPGSIGTRADVCTLIRDSQYIVEDVSDTQVNQVVSGALDRLHYERDPCVQFDTDRKLWVYLHREREEEDFEDDGTSSTKKWKRQKKESAEPIDQAAVTVAYHGPGDQNVGDLGSDPNFDLPNIHEDKGKELEYEDSRDLGDDNVENHHGTEQGNPRDFGQTQVASDAMGENKLFCQENSTNDNFDDET